MKVFKRIHGRRGRHRGGRALGASRGRGGRMLGHGDLKFLLLGLIAEKPSHGYELIKAIEERGSGAYSPSPGVIYPSLALLEDLGWVREQPGEEGKKRYAVTEEGSHALAANKAVIEAIDTRLGELRARMARDGASGEGETLRGFGRSGQPIRHEFHRLRRALRSRVFGGRLNDAEITAVAAALAEAATKVEAVQVTEPGNRA